MAGRPEIMCRRWADCRDLEPLLEQADAVVVGPGLGRRLGPRVVAARAGLGAAARRRCGRAESARRGARRARHWILTPHPGEAARLLGGSVARRAARPVAAGGELAARYDAVAVLKGAGTLVARHDGECRSRCATGAIPGMATAGMGDVLAGVLGGLAVQRRDLPHAASAGVLLHALAGDEAAAGGERGTIAADLLPHLQPMGEPA